MPPKLRATAGDAASWDCAPSDQSGSLPHCPPKGPPDEANTPQRSNARRLSCRIANSSATISTAALGGLGAAAPTAATATAPRTAAAAPLAAALAAAVAGVEAPRAAGAGRRRRRRRSRLRRRRRQSRRRSVRRRIVRRRFVRRGLRGRDVERPRHQPRGRFHRPRHRRNRGAPLTREPLEWNG